MQNTVRTRLIAEEVLIRYQTEFGEDAPLTVNETRRLFRDSLVLTVEGRSYDPFSATDEQAVLHRLLADIGIAPTWHYKNGKNIITISKERKRKISDLQRILIALILGFGLGFLSRLFPDALIHTMAQDVLAPLSDTMMSFLSAMAVLLIFFPLSQGAAAWGICPPSSASAKR